MRILAFLIPALFALTTLVRAEMLPDPEIENVIRDQMTAFEADDFDTAFGFAAPNIQMIFRNSDNFGMMVRRGYPMVWRPAGVRFGPLRTIDGTLWQQVIVTDQEGRLHVLDYAMEDIGGQWRIAGVQLIPAPDVAV
ncbi:MAG: DUF4864 domain-containing protein [Pseudomonadota bacterium]|nr:DUF4864 domain-containing protein [Pseudomonadota bacterium]